MGSEKNKNASPDEKFSFFNTSNIQVAVLCNHQRTASKNFGTQMEKMDQKIEDDEKYIEELEDAIKRLKRDKKPKQKELKEGEKDPHPIPSTVEGCEKKIEMIKNRIKRNTIKKKDKDNQKEIAVGTSKVNYIDPRIIIAWCKKVDLDVSKVFTKVLRDKFGWAFKAVEEDKEFEF